MDEEEVKDTEAYFAHLAEEETMTKDWKEETNPEYTKMREALEFYANGEYWYEGLHAGNVIMDEGKKAREVLGIE